MEEEKKNEGMDNILDSISDKIVAKRKKKRKIISSAILSIILAFSILVITFANINISTKPNFIASADLCEVYINGTQTDYIGQESNSYKDFIKEYNSIFKTNFLTAMFTGKLDKYTIIEPEKDLRFYTNNTDKSGMHSDLKNLLGSNYIHFNYNTDQKVLTKGGKQYYSSNYPKNKYALKFVDCYLKLDTQQKDTMTFYLGTYDYSTPVVTKVVVKASSYNLYKYFSK